MVVLCPHWWTPNVGAVSTPRSGSPRSGRRIATGRIASVTLLAFALGGLATVLPLPADSSASAVSANSSLTVKWAGDTSTASGYQPDRTPSSPHYAEFKNIAITVSQTSGIIDQAVRVSVTGFAGTQSYYRSGITADNAKNYLQAMQCWGPDPRAADFNQTCQWGGRALVTNSGLGSSVIPDNALRVGTLDVDPSNPTTHDVPFRTVDGKTVSGKPVLKDGQTNYPILDYFGPSTTNEVVSSRVSADGTGFFDFETQSSDQAPQLGCGTAAHLRCWLVVVPRGTVFGGNGATCSGIKDPANGNVPYTKGRPNSVQGGSPVNDNCDYFDNRIVIPLDFTPTGATCAVGSTEFRVVGSQLMVGAMSSWQPSLCKTVKSTFSFATNSDSLARSQLIGTSTNSPRIAYSGYPVSSGELNEAERTTLSKTALQYAPVAVSSVVIAFLAEGYDGRQQQLNISPRIMAKILTQSYKFTVPYNSSDPDKNLAHLPAVNLQYEYLRQDPDFQALNPTNYDKFAINPGIVLPGPGGADAIKQVWRWILADRDAVSFLNGNPDPSGMTVNPYYLPKGDPKAVVPWWLDDAKNYIGETPVQLQVGLSNLDGSPQKLSETVPDTFPKDDESVVPLNLGIERYRFDSIQFSPYVNDILAGARAAFRADPNSKTIWDPSKLNASGDVGDWVSGGAQPPGARFMIAVTDSVSAARYGLDLAGIEIPNSAVISHPDQPSMTNALSALASTTIADIKQVDPAAVPVNGYPMTMVTYAGVNLTTSTTEQRTTIAAMIKQVTTTGQVEGSEIGQLPAGYLPLTDALRAQATTAASAVAAYVPPTRSVSSNSSSSTSATQGSGSGGGEDSTDLQTLSNDPTVTSGVDQQSDALTPTSNVEPVVRSGLALALGVGLAGVLIAPILFRGRGFF